MGNYALFSGLNYYPSGGWNDLVDIFDTKEAASLAGQNLMRKKRGDFMLNDWYDVVDLLCRKVVESGSSGF